MANFIPSENRTQRIIIADYYNVIDSHAIVELMDQYAQDKMGGGAALPDSVKTALVSSMANVPGAFSVLALIGGKPAGLINCFMGFSTFKAKPLINIHDVIVLSEYRGRKLSQLMLEKVEAVARERGCCKLTLEVLQGNKIAQNAYLKFGFGGYELDPEMGGASFWQKAL
ncbi:MAG: ribosomal protein S18 acetylase RimI-like enzyme [Oleispira sp.]|jgi:ribosomal protein S18 acetylase RimI-like enzyme